MALVRYGGGIVEIRGSIAGNVHSRNSSGNYIRARTTPINPRSSRQDVIRAAMATASNSWLNSLTPAQRTAWALYAANINMTNKLGETILISGRSHYLRSNMARINSNLGPRDDGPTLLALPSADSAFNIVANIGAQTLTVTFDDTADWPGENSAHMIISMSQPKNSAVNFIGGPFRIVGVLSGSGSSSLSSPATMGSLPFVISADQVVGFKARITRNDGRLSEPFRDSRVTTTA